MNLINMDPFEKIPSEEIQYFKEKVQLWVKIAVKVKNN